MGRIFDHAKLEIHRAALAFLDSRELVRQKLPKSLSVGDPLEQAS